MHTNHRREFHGHNPRREGQRAWSRKRQVPRAILRYYWGAVRLRSITGSRARGGRTRRLADIGIGFFGR